MSRDQGRFWKNTTMKRAATLSIIILVLILGGCAPNIISFRPNGNMQKPNIQGTYRNTGKWLEGDTMQIRDDGTLTIIQPGIPSLDNPHPPNHVSEYTWDHLVGGSGTWHSFGIEIQQEKGVVYQLVGQFLLHNPEDMAVGIKSDTRHITSDGGITDGVMLYKKENSQ